MGGKRKGLRGRARGGEGKEREEKIVETGTPKGGKRRNGKGEEDKGRSTWKGT